MCRYIIELRDLGNGELEIHKFDDKVIFQKNSKGGCIFNLANVEYILQIAATIPKK